MNIESTALYQQLAARRLVSAPAYLFEEFNRFRLTIQAHSTYISVLLPEYTPHDYTNHLDHLFILADRILGLTVYERLSGAELFVLAFGLYGHDWGMAVSIPEQICLVESIECEKFDLIQGEPSSALSFVEEYAQHGGDKQQGLRDYLRQTHGARSGARLRRFLQPLGSTFAEAVAKVAEGHALDIREIRDVGRYQPALSLFGEVVNLAVIATYVRIVDLLDLGEDRTPFALWKFVSPIDATSKVEWRKHRALSPISVLQGPTLREILVSGSTDDPETYAALADLNSWVEKEFVDAVVLVRNYSTQYDLRLDSRIRWSVAAVGFEPLLVKFELDRTQILGLLSRELYQGDRLAFVRELLQNSVDAIDTRASLFQKQGLPFAGRIVICLRELEGNISVEWTDNGVGMNEDVLSSYFARIGCSWYQSKQARKLAVTEPISRFGVGILSCFAVSSAMALRTRRDPYLADGGRTLEIKVPRRESHFRITTSDSGEVGTTIQLNIPSALNSDVSIESIMKAVREVARYVNHSVVLETEAASLTICPSENIAELRVQNMRGERGALFIEQTKAVRFPVGDKHGDYEGFYTTLVPTSPREATSSSSYNCWTLGGKDIDLSDVIVDVDQCIYIKGVRVGRVSATTHRGRYSNDSLLAYRHSGWISPTIHLNLKRPSLLDFDLSRATARFEQADWVVKVWREIAQRLRSELFNWPLDDPESRACMLGACAIFGGVPNEGLVGLLSEEALPVMMLEPGRGIVWDDLGPLLTGEEFIETPFEIDYGYSNNNILRGWGGASKLSGWNGERSLFAPTVLNARQWPWLTDVASFVRGNIYELGWEPVEVKCVEPGVKDSVPLAVRVWKKTGLRAGTAPHYQKLKKLYDEAPELLQFPDELSEFVGIGSRYWNVNHPKGVAIVKILMELVQRRNAGKLSERSASTVRYLCSSAYYGYVVPSRKSGKVLAIDLINKLLSVAEDERIGHGLHLEVGDFVPGTVDGYENPYHCDFKHWDVPRSKLGTPYHFR